MRGGEELRIFSYSNNNIINCTVKKIVMKEMMFSLGVYFVAIGVVKLVYVIVRIKKGDSNNADR